MKLKHWLPKYRSITYAQYKQLPEETKCRLMDEFLKFIRRDKEEPKKEKWIEIKPKSHDSIDVILEKERIRYETNLKIGGIDSRGNYTALSNRWANDYECRHR